MSLSSSEHNDYVIEFYIASLTSVVNKRMVQASRIQELLLLLDWDVLEIDTLYDLSLVDRAAIESYFALVLGNNTNQLLVRKAIWIDYLSYEVHTGRELYLMLEGEKPLSVFTGSQPKVAGETPEESFEPYVLEGRIIHREFVLSSSKYNQDFVLRYVLYALPGEEWRMEDYLELVKVINLEGPSAEYERKEGRLLGYSDAEIDEFLAQQYEHKKCAEDRLKKYLELPTKFERV